MLKDFLPPTQAEEYRNTAAILRELAAQLRFDDTRDALINLADNLDRLASRVGSQRIWSNGFSSQASDESAIRPRRD